MIYSHLPSTSHQIEFPLGGAGRKYIVADPATKRVAVMEVAWEDRQRGFREVVEVSESNLYMLAPAWQTYVRLWWEKWGV